VTITKNIPYTKDEIKIDCNSMINIRPKQGNRSNEIQDVKIREEFEKLTKYFFQLITCSQSFSDRGIK